MTFRNAVSSLFATLLTVGIVFLAGCPAPHESQTEGPVKIVIGDPKVGSDGKMTAEVKVGDNPTQEVPVTAVAPRNGEVTLIFTGVSGKEPITSKGEIYFTQLLAHDLSKILTGDKEQLYINPGFGVLQGADLYFVRPEGHTLGDRENFSIRPANFTHVVKAEGETDVHALIRTRLEIQAASDRKHAAEEAAPR